MGYWRLSSALDEEGAFADPLAEVMKLGATHLAFVGYFDLGNTWSVNWEYALDAFAIRNLTNCECSVDAAAAFGDHETCEDLDALFATFNHSAMDFHGVAHVERGDVLFELLLFDFLDDVHGRGCGKVF